MGRQRRHHAHYSQQSGPGPAATTAGPVPGRYDIDTGTAEIIADDLHPNGFILQVNGVPSSYIALGAPEHMEFEYMRWIAAAVASWHPNALRMTHLGGAGCSLPRYFAHRNPRSRHTVIELDAALGHLVREHFDIPRAPTVKIRAAEARHATENFYPGSRDIIIRDVFSGSTTPRPLTTVEFFAAAQRALSPDGLYLANCGDRPPLAGAKAELAAMATVFQHLAVIADPPMLKGRRYGNIILAGSNRPLEITAQLTKELLGGAVPAQARDHSWVEKFMAGAVPLVDPPRQAPADAPGDAGAQEPDPPAAAEVGP